MNKGGSMNNYFMETHHHEWILSNQKGAYALGTGNLINQRKYHGLLIGSDSKLNRLHLVAGMEEKIEWRGESFHLDSNNYRNCIHPEGFLYLVKPWLRPYPSFLYSALPHQDDILILKELMMDEKQNCILVKYTNLGYHTLHFYLHPKFTMIPHHEVNPRGSLDSEQFDSCHYNDSEGCMFDVSRPSKSAKVYCHSRLGSCEPNRYVYYDVYYPWEVMKGYEGIGEQISLFELKFSLKVGQSNYILFSDERISDPRSMVEEIEKRYAELPRPADLPKDPANGEGLLSTLDYDDKLLYNREEYLKVLAFALHDFVVLDDVVAGYPWYGAWGRDTMIVLNALLHQPEHYSQVEKILKKYSRHINGGLIPNAQRESGRDANYDSVDATLWYIILLWKLGKRKAEPAYWKDAIQLCEYILGSILENQFYPFDLRSDGLINLKAEFAHATWMDVRQDGKAVTPRDGACVEINALWYNALCCYEAMCESYEQSTGIGYPPKEHFSQIKDMVKGSFSKFWMEEGYLADRLIGEEQIKQIRPNAVLALSLPWPTLDIDQMKQVFLRAETELLTPYGLRSLSPKDPDFHKKYYGTQAQRDLAYHNGSTWAWLLGAFCGLALKVYRSELDDQALAEKLSSYVQTFRNSFSRGHIASVAEIWDGEHPHFPKGAPAQAISVAALYNIETFIDSIRK